MDNDKKVEPQDERAELDDELTDEDKAYFEAGGARDGGEAAEASGKPETGTKERHEQPDASKQRMVPHGALHAEREEHKKTKQALAELQEKAARFDERLKLLAGLKEPGSREERVPDPEQDLPGYVQHLEARVTKAEETARQTAETTTKAFDEQKAQSDLHTAYVADARRFASGQADFGEAYRFLVDSRVREYQAMGVTDDAEIARRVQQDEMALASEALDVGESPSRRLYDVSIARGYAPPASEGDGDSEQREPAAKTEGEERLRQLGQAQEANKSLSSVAGAAGGTLTTEALAEMSEEEFQEVYERLKREDPKQLQALMM